MLIARNSKGKKDLLLVGLTRDERKRLDAGEPLRLPPCRLPGNETTLWIFGGYDQHALIDEMERVLGAGESLDMALVVR
jgi:hypothetical protein